MLSWPSDVQMIIVLFVECGVTVITTSEPKNGVSEISKRNYGSICCQRTGRQARWVAVSI